MFKTRRHTIIASQRNPMMLTPPCVLVHLSPHPDNNNNSTGTRPETLRPARSGASFAVECFDRRPSRDVRQVRWGWGSSSCLVLPFACASFSASDPSPKGIDSTTRKISQEGGPSMIGKPRR